MIINSRNFRTEAKKLGGFSFRTVQTRYGEEWKVISKEITTRYEVPFYFHIRKDFTHSRIGDPPSEISRFGNDLELLDSIFALQQKKLGLLNKEELLSEVPERIRLGYFSSWAFTSVLPLYLKTLPLREQKAFVLRHDLPYFLCDITNQWKLTRELIVIKLDFTRYTVCADGFRACVQAYVREDDSTFWSGDWMPFYTISGSTVSLDTILNSDITECEGCNSLSWGGGGRICQTCYPGVTIESIYLQYSAKAERVFQFKHTPEEGKRKQLPLYLGVELELENRTADNLLATWKSLKTHALIKRDGSVSTGMEICSAPATYEVHKEEFKNFFSIAKDSNLRAKENCGMHVHVDKVTLSELQIGKILSFFYNKENKKLINVIAGRKDNSYCTLDQSRTITSGIHYDEYRKKLVRQQPEGRYSGINLLPEKTIEFRIFASTTSYEIFLKNLEFVQSMVDFTKPGAVAVKKLSDFADKRVYFSFIKENKKTYPNLYKFFSEKLSKELQAL